MSLTRRQLFGRALATVAVVALEPVARILPEPLAAPIEAVVEKSKVSLTAYDEILRRVYAPVIRKSLMRQTLLLDMFLAKEFVDGKVQVWPKRVGTISSSRSATTYSLEDDAAE